MTEVTVGIDIGTSSVKAVAADAALGDATDALRPTLLATATSAATSRRRAWWPSKAN